MYKGQSGMWAWLLHRVTGIGILLFLLIHIVDVSLLGFGPAVYNDGIRLFDFWIARLLSLALIAAVLFHAYNGIRIIHLLVMHVTTDVACTTFQFVASRYANPLWRLFDWLLLTLALLHGMNGLRVVMDDYVPSRTWRIRILSVLGVLTLAFFMLGTITIIAFQNVPASLLGPHCVQFH